LLSIITIIGGPLNSHSKIPVIRPFTMEVSRVLILVSGVVFFLGLSSTVYLSVTNENTFEGSTGVVTLDSNQEYSVFLHPDDGNDICSDIQVSVVGEGGDEFQKECLNRDDRQYLGNIIPSVSGDYNISASSKIVIEKYPMTETTEFLHLMLSEAVCCLGLVGVLVGVAIASRTKA